LINRRVMDERETIAKLRDRVIRFRDARNWEQFHDPRNLAMGLSIEGAELLELFLWKSDKEIREMLEDETTYRKVREELADIFVFLLYLSKGCSVDLSEAVTKKLEVNEKKYPIEKSFGSNRKYNQLE
jgi:NTP pyrophosphatase (non-canonical NTP hydrolase)